MTSTRKKPTTIQDAARQALELRQQRRAEGLAPVEITPEQIALAGVLRERDHLEGCPVPAAVDGPARVEAYAEAAIAPGPELRSVGVAPGETVLVIRCHGCGGIRYVGDFAGLSPAPARDALVDRELARLAGLEEELEGEGEELDETL